MNELTLFFDSLAKKCLPGHNRCFIVSLKEDQEWVKAIGEQKKENYGDKAQAKPAPSLRRKTRKRTNNRLYSQYENISISMSPMTVLSVGSRNPSQNLRFSAEPAEDGHVKASIGCISE